VELDPVDQRVLGSLLEKERTVPATYPLTLNALRSACNQTSGRDPITHLEDHQLTASIDRLKGLGLARIVHAGTGSRATKYRQVLDERLDLEPAERAVVTLLLLRGPQTPGELRSRADRLHAFDELAEVDAALRALAGRDEPLVEEQERRPGQKERRWTHLLGPVAPGAAAGAADATVATDPADIELAIAEGGEQRDRKVVDVYDQVAGAYADALLDELDGKPFDRWLLERLAAAADGPVADVGTGPGHVAAHLAAAGAADVTGFDLSPGMVAEARARWPELHFEVADLRALPSPASGGGWSLITAWYALVHLAGSEVAAAIAALAGAVRPGGTLAFAVHIGRAVQHLDDWMGHDVDIVFTFHDPDRVLAAVGAAGLVDVEWYRRGPSPATSEGDHERLYVVAHRPA
jgi:uncharacterized protein YceH (UPF0502 family)